MPAFQPESSAHVVAIARPRCPNCSQDRMLLAKLETGSFGSGSRTFECQKCGLVSTVVVPADPMKSSALGWLASELRPPT
jgi:uncharacterized Zn finger protein